MAAWTSYTPTVTSQTGTITTLGTVSGAYLTVGKTVFLRADVVVTTAGTAAGSIKVSIPIASKSANFAGSIFEYNIAGKSGAVVINPSVNGTGIMFARYADGTTVFANGAGVTLQIVYEIP
jgi:hypothetical protein